MRSIIFSSLDDNVHYVPSKIHTERKYCWGQGSILLHRTVKCAAHSSIEPRVERSARPDTMKPIDNRVNDSVFPVVSDGARSTFGEQWRSGGPSATM